MDRLSTIKHSRAVLDHRKHTPESFCRQVNPHGFFVTGVTDSRKQPFPAEIRTELTTAFILPGSLSGGTQVSGNYLRSGKPVSGNGFPDSVHTAAGELKQDVISANRKGQTALWAYGISGDLPVILLRISMEHMEMVKQVLTAHEYSRLKVR